MQLGAKDKESSASAQMSEELQAKLAELDAQLAQAKSQVRVAELEMQLAAKDKGSSEAAHEQLCKSPHDKRTRTGCE